MRTDREEATRVAYEEQPTHRNTTPGTFPVWRSPFTTPYKITEALTKRDCVAWFLWTTDHVGGQTGSWTFAMSNDIKPLLVTQDSRGLWYIALNNGRNWGMIDLDETQRLADFVKFANRCDEQSAGAQADSEAAQDMRHPTF